MIVCPLCRRLGAGAELQGWIIYSFIQRSQSYRCWARNRESTDTEDGALAQKQGCAGVGCCMAAVGLSPALALAFLVPATGRRCPFPKTSRVWIKWISVKLKQIFGAWFGLTGMWLSHSSIQSPFPRGHGKERGFWTFPAAAVTAQPAPAWRRRLGPRVRGSWSGICGARAGADGVTAGPALLSRGLVLGSSHDALCPTS